MKTLHLITFISLLLIGFSAAIQAQCSTSVTHTGSGNSYNFTASNVGIASGSEHVWTIFDASAGGVTSTVTTYAPNLSWVFAGPPAGSFGAHSFMLVVTDTITGCQAYFSDTLYAGNNPCFGFNAVSMAVQNANVVSFASSVSGGTPGYSYAWDFGDGTTSTLANPTHTYTHPTAMFVNVTLTVTDANGCSSTDVLYLNVMGSIPCSLGISVNMNQDPNDPFLIWMQPVIRGASLSNGFAFVWNFGDGTIQTGLPSHTYTNYGTYEVCVTVYDSTTNCDATFCDTITLDSAGNFSRNPNTAFTVNILAPISAQVTNVATIEAAALAVEVYPNPVNNVVNVSIETGEVIDGTISILDLTGKILHQEGLNVAEGEQQMAISVDDLATGIYLLRVTSQATQKTIKFIKQ